MAPAIVKMFCLCEALFSEADAAYMSSTIGVDPPGMDLPPTQLVDVGMLPLTEFLKESLGQRKRKRNGSRRETKRGKRRAQVSISMIGAAPTASSSFMQCVRMLRPRKGA